jgi:predicted TIM-barrel fold metal-dependent hydrolase
MTALETPPEVARPLRGPEPIVDYGIYDADEHYYETTDAITRHLEPQYRRNIKWIDMEGRKTLLINNKLVTVVPNPTYDPVGVPGSLEPYFRAENHEGRELRDIIKMDSIKPAYFERDARVKLMDAQGVDFAWLLPSLGLGLEEMLSEHPESAHAIFRSYNRWLEEAWGYDRDGRLQTGPLITFLDVEEAEKELARVIEVGVKFVTLRPAPTRLAGRHRSPGDKAHDRFWSMCEDANIVIGIHAADSGYGPYLADWGESTVYTGMKATTLSEVMSVHIERPIYDMMAAMVCHGVFDRHPKLRVATLELGSAWVGELHRHLRVAYGKTPQLFGSDPVQSFREHVWIAPFYEDDVRVLRDLQGADRVLLGSDFPHPEGLAEPRAWAPDFAGLPPNEQRMALRENLKSLSGR